MSALAILTAARARISDRAAWTRCWYARDAAGLRVDAEAPEARAWCAYGAIYAEGVSLYGQAADLLRRAARAVHNHSVPIVNDHLGHRAVLAMYDHAIALAAAEAEAR